MGSRARARSRSRSTSHHARAARRRRAAWSACPFLPPFVLRLALLAERLHALFEVVRREEAADCLMLEQHRVRERHAGALHRGKLYLTLRQGRTAAIRRRPLLGLRLQLRRWDDDV